MKRVQDLKVKHYNWLNADNYILTLSSDSDIEDVNPGNFAEIKVPDAPDVFLRRPISILDVDHDTNTIRFYIKAIGKGGKRLTVRSPQQRTVVGGSRLESEWGFPTLALRFRHRDHNTVLDHELRGGSRRFPEGIPASQVDGRKAFAG